MQRKSNRANLLAMNSLRRITLPMLAMGAIGLSACGGTTAVKVSTDPQVRKDEAQAQALIKTCITKSSIITHAGRQKFIACVAPAGKKAQVEACVQKKLAGDKFFTHGQRAKAMQDVVTCLVAK